ncbi:MAG: uracil-DNA glycosylase [Deltaproteobacteria bacterium]|nr:uracil-DNA glycosylase [Deltaproteobacteria bacterium]
MNLNADKVEKSWQAVLGDEFETTHMKALGDFLRSETENGLSIFPAEKDVFAAFTATPFDKVRVVILGQDPYHGAGQAHGLSFSVEAGVRLPPSLLNIYKELESDLGIPRGKSGSLREWANQGVLLLNSVLTVRENQAASHQRRGWEQFTDRAIKELADRREGIVFILWGAYALKKAAFVDRSKHRVIESVHPSPLSASRGFFGSRPFSKINQYFASRAEPPIDWAAHIRQETEKEKNTVTA